MSFSTSNHVFDNGSAANYKDWGKAISDALTAAGWTYVADTGSIAQDWSDNPAVPASGLYKFQIWKPNDALTAFYMKIEFGNLGGANNPAMRTSIGTGTNGAGTLTGVATIGPLTWSPQNSQAGTGATTYDCRFYGTASSFACIMWRNAPDTDGCYFGVERLLDSSGADTSDGVTIVLGGRVVSGIYNRQQTLLLNPSTIATAQLNSVIVLGPCTSGATATSDLYNSSISVSPVFPMYGKFGNPMTLFARVSNADITEATTVTTTLYGSVHTYFATKAQSCFGAFNAGSLAGVAAMLMRYE